jgi:hypothetical protein
MTEPKMVKLGDFLTEKEIVKASQLWRNLPPGVTFVQRVCDEIIKPNMERINKALGQENDPMYLAWMVVYVVGQALHE